METVDTIDGPLWPGERSVITVGMYDGVHLGHRRVIEAVRAEAAARRCRSVVVTFDRHPMSIVRPGSEPRLLTSLEHKLELLASTGVDAALVIPFGPAQAVENAVEFVERVVVGAVAARSVIVGSDFHFGHMRQGNLTLLSEMGERHGFEAGPVALLGRADGVDEPVSSTAIRRALAGGEIETANRMLGRPHEVRGTVGHGDKRGRTIGFPTANVEVPAGMCVPADGVYAGEFVRADGSRHPCAVNIGRRPTFYADAQVSLVEAHLMGFSGDLYDEKVAVTFRAFLRSERQFAGLEELRSQLTLDVEHAAQAVRRDSV